MNKTLGQRIKELRDVLDLSLRELAQRMNSGSVSATHLSDIEQGRRYPSEELLEKLAKALETTVEDLRQYDSRPPLEEIKRRTETDPNFGFALRKLVDKEVSSDDILNFINKKSKEK
jgi:transcriptional regulator with XRE-family HTH domain